MIWAWHLKHAKWGSVYDYQWNVWLYYPSSTVENRALIYSCNRQILLTLLQAAPWMLVVHQTLALLPWHCLTQHFLITFQVAKLSYHSTAAVYILSFLIEDDINQPCVCERWLRSIKHYTVPATVQLFFQILTCTSDKFASGKQKVYYLLFCLCLSRPTTMQKTGFSWFSDEWAI
jgi:hypothetical protein